MVDIFDIIVLIVGVERASSLGFGEGEVLLLCILLENDSVVRTGE